MSTIRLLIAEDNEELKNELFDFFADQPDIIVAGEAGNGLEALKIIRETPIDVLLLDMIMPHMDGFGVLEHMKKDNELQKIPVVIVTDDSSEETSVKAFEYDVADMVIKPFEPRIIKRRVQNIIELYAYRNEERRNEL